MGRSDNGGVPDDAERGTRGHEPESRSGYRVLVAVGNPAHVDQLVRTAGDLAVDRGGEIVVLSVIVKPYRSPFSIFTDETIEREFGRDRQEILDRALRALGKRDAPVRGEVRVSHDLAAAVVGAVREHDCDGVVLGWRERPRFDLVFGSDVDRTATNAPCDVLVEKIGATADGVESVLLVAADGPHGDLAADVARAVARMNEARVEVVRIVDPGASDADPGEDRRLIDSAVAGLDDVEVERSVRASDDPAETVLSLTERHDVTVIGATAARPLRRSVMGAVPERVAKRAEKTVILARRNCA
ncbi:universal stress protein [Halegenticoccus soli]|uniref:universal stress protein n=1 Tax=Halegenticoccus soli TaxID=1985678 RepID=UPI000C6DCDEB|nr:universal stress protein [Halegenticoccus soli]